MGDEMFQGSNQILGWRMGNCLPCPCSGSLPPLQEDTFQKVAQKFHTQPSE